MLRVMHRCPCAFAMLAVAYCTSMINSVYSSRAISRTARIIWSGAVVQHVVLAVWYILYKYRTADIPALADAVLTIPSGIAGT